MRWNLNGLGSITASDLRLLIDQNNNGVFNDETPIAGAIHLGGGIYEFQSVPAGSGSTRNNKRFTIATIDRTQTPLPISLISFTALAVNRNAVSLSWQTSSETNNDFFTVEKSTDGESWEIVGELSGAGQSSQILSYALIDVNPFVGNSYYRLKQTDYDQNFSYSKVVSVYFDNKQSLLTIYPNPTTNILIIEGSLEALASIRIYDLVGRELTQSIRAMQATEENAQFDFVGLPSGCYILTADSNSYLVHKH